MTRIDKVLLAVAIALIVANAVTITWFVLQYAGA